MRTVKPVIIQSGILPSSIRLLLLLLQNKMKYCLLGKRSYDRNSHVGTRFQNDSNSDDTLAVMSNYPVINVIHLFFDITIPQSFRYMDGITQCILYENIIFFLHTKVIWKLMAALVLNRASCGLQYNGWLWLHVLSCLHESVLSVIWWYQS